MSETDPHADDICVVCKRGPECGETMFPVVSMDNGHVCGKCVVAAEAKLPWGVSDK